MAAKTNLTTAAQITVNAREVDFVTRFGKNWDALRTIMGHYAAPSARPPARSWSPMRPLLTALWLAVRPLPRAMRFR